MRGWCLELALVATLMLPAATVVAEDSVSSPITYSGYLYSYYAYDWNQHGKLKRPYTTQAYYNDEPAVNLAYLDVKTDQSDYRGRLALQAGTAVDANYAAEQDEWVQYIQEAVVGAKISDKLWIDGGIYFSHIGFENWISANNWNYTRSLIAEYSPYYQSGIYATYTPTTATTVQLHLLNGWQNISNDADPALGLKIAQQIDPKVAVSYSNYLGNQKGEGTRFFNDFVLSAEIVESFQFAAAFDIGFQELGDGEGEGMWNGFSLMSQYSFSDGLRLGSRLERFFDPDQIVVDSLSDEQFAVWGSSVNLDYELATAILLRMEYKFLWNNKAVFPENEEFTYTDSLFVVSITAKI